MRSGVTTKLSVVIATARAVHQYAGGVAQPVALAGSLRLVEQRREQALDQAACALPPAPCAISICGSRNRIGAEVAVRRTRRQAGVRIRSARRGLPMLVVVVGRARAFRRHHQRADRVLGRALLAEQLALGGLEHALQHLAALRGLRVGDPHARRR